MLCSRVRSGPLSTESHPASLASRPTWVTFQNLVELRPHRRSSDGEDDWFQFSGGILPGSASAQLAIETNATRFTSGFLSAFDTGERNDYRLCALHPRAFQLGNAAGRLSRPRLSHSAQAQAHAGLTRI
jgi:hypothetical protein